MSRSYEYSTIDRSNERKVNFLEPRTPGGPPVELKLSGGKLNGVYKRYDNTLHCDKAFDNIGYITIEVSTIAGHHLAALLKMPTFE